MTNNSIIVCPKCKTEIKLAEAMSGPMLEKIKQDYEKKLISVAEEAKANQMTLREKIIKEEARKARADAQSVLEQTKQASKIIQEDMVLVEQKNRNLLDDLQRKEMKLAEAQKEQADFAKKSRELDDAKREMDLTIEKRISEQLEASRFQARKEAEDSLKLKVMEKEQTITSMQTVIADLKRKAEQGSQQVQGEVQEVELEKMLSAKFPHDVISEVPKGISGADCVQEVKDSSGKLCGNIIWESKRTKSWSDGWLAKLRDDQRTAKADIAILVTQVLPKEVTGFDFIEGVYVTKLETVVPLAMTIRQSIIEVSLARGAGEGQKSKMEMLYHYLTGTQFRQRVQAIVEAFSTMHEDLFKEKKAIAKSWAKREEQITNVMESTVGLHGDIQGIAGKAVKEIEGLEIRQIAKDSRGE